MAGCAFAPARYDMQIVLIGPELEENLGLRYIATSLERAGHLVAIISFATEYDTPQVVRQVLEHDPAIAGLSMVFTGRAREFCRLAQALRAGGYRGHLVAGGHFASFNCEQLLRDFPEFDSIALGEGEEFMCALAANLDDLSRVSGVCYRASNGSIVLIPSRGNPENLDALPFPKRTTFHTYFDKPIASVLTSRGCWRDCAFCSINAWYKRSGGKRFRVRSVDNIVMELKDLYFQHGIRIFNFQDDNFFLPDPAKAAERFEHLQSRLRAEGVGQIAIAVKARPDSITRASIRVLDKLGLFRVFLGVENASETGLRNLNRKSCLAEVLNALEVLNDFDVHIAYNILMFEPETTLDDVVVNLRFMERHIENPFNFCRAEAYAGTGLESKLVAEGRLLGNYFGFDYRLRDPYSETLHQIANHAFFERNFSDYGLHYFNMQVDFYFQLLRRFHPELLTESLRAAVRNFIKYTNLDTYECLSRIYDFVSRCNPADQPRIREFAREMRETVDERSRELLVSGESILKWLETSYERRGQGTVDMSEMPVNRSHYGSPPESKEPQPGWPNPFDPLGLTPIPIPYDVFKARLAAEGHGLPS
jgi:anaerobic magnesium-protoporphyrin IX monomethyl ester cyclase